MEELVGDGAGTGFWHDTWLGPAPLTELFPALYSHTERPHASVQDAIAAGTWESTLGPLLSAVASQERSILHTALQAIQLRPLERDKRYIRGAQTSYSTSRAYALQRDRFPSDNGAMEIWQSPLPPKCKHFLCLIHRDRLPTRELLHRRRISDSAACPFCSEPETQVHLLLHCTHARRIWDSVGANGVAANSGIEDIWNAPSLWEAQKSTSRLVTLTAVLWNIWKS